MSRTSYWLTISEVSATTRLSRDTIKRALIAGRFPNARRRDDVNATWEIPVADLTEAGYRLHPPADTPETAVSTPALVGEGIEALELRDRVHQLEVALADARRAAEERSGRIADLQMALAALSQRPTLREAS